MSISGSDVRQPGIVAELLAEKRRIHQRYVVLMAAVSKHLEEACVHVNEDGSSTIGPEIPGAEVGSWCRVCTKYFPPPGEDT